MSASYKDKIYKMLMELEGEFDISQKVAPENVSQFIDCVKEFIRIGSQHTKKQIEFSSDYKKIRVID